MKRIDDIMLIDGVKEGIKTKAWPESFTRHAERVVSLCESAIECASRDDLRNQSERDIDDGAAQLARRILRSYGSRPE